MITTIRSLELSERESVELTAAGSLADVLIACAAIFAATAGLVGMVPVVAAACATVAIGIAMLFEGGAIGARFARTIKHREEGDLVMNGDVLAGLTADLVAGASGVVLGVLAFAGVAPLPLLATAVLVFAAGLLMGCAAQVHATAQSRKADSFLIAARAQLVVGIVSLVLGIVALLGAAVVPLTLVALLLVGLSELVSGMALGTKMFRMSRS